jgi:hypothetical protein
VLVWLRTSLIGNPITQTADPPLLDGSPFFQRQERGIGVEKMMTFVHVQTPQVRPKSAFFVHVQARSFLPQRTLVCYRRWNTAMRMFCADDERSGWNFTHFMVRISFSLNAFLCIEALF